MKEILNTRQDQPCLIEVNFGSTKMYHLIEVTLLIGTELTRQALWQCAGNQEYQALHYKNLILYLINLIGLANYNLEMQ